MTAVLNFEGGAIAAIIDENEKTYLLVICDEAQQSYRFRIDMNTLARLNVESAARILTKVQRGYAFVKNVEGLNPLSS